jgi:eukaryotic-like serine/threonine-protein kinase
MSELQQIGRYQILGELGRGATGRVVKAEDPTIRRQVAIKVIRLGAGSTKEEQELFERSFLREIRAAGVLHHPGIISIFDAGRQDDLAYIVMELVDGVTLEAMLNAGERPDMGTLLDICRRVATALDYAHGHGIVHRDIKPANVLVAADGAARIADFGVAKFSKNGTLSFGKAGVAGGTPAYMSPEQIMGKSLDGRADQWALAVVLYDVLTGSRPFPAENIAVTLGQVMSIDPAPPSSLNPLLPAGIDAAMAKAFSKDPARRYASCAELMQALDGIFQTGSDEPEQATEWQATATETGPAEVVSPSLPVEAPIRKRPVGLIVGAAVALVALVAGGILFMRNRSAGDAASDSAGTSASPFTVKPLEASRPRPSAPAPAANVSTTPAPVAARRPAGSPAAKMLQVRFVTTPPEASVTVDGKREATCKSPCTMELAEGSHTLLLQKDGYRTMFQNFSAGAGQPEIATTLNELTGSLLVQSDPPGAAIAVNGKPRTEVTPAALSLAPGKYKVTLSKAGFAPADFDASVMANALREISVGLAKSQ